MMLARQRSVLIAPVLVAAVVLAATLALAWRDRGGERASQGLSAIAMLSEPPQPGFDRALEPRELVFPADHGPHPTFQTEWWYFTGHLATDAGRRFGFQLTFFRRAQASTPPEGDSRWLASQTYLAHFALTDVEGRRFVAAERSQRGALDLAGAHASPWRVWVDGWSAESIGDDFAPLRLRASAGGVAIELELAPTRAPVLHGERGLSTKGASEGNASHYYSMPRIDARGAVEVDGARLDVAGRAWLDREWGTSALEPGIVGWDWFALELDDGRDLMLYRLRAQDGAASRFSEGTLVERDGRATRLRREDFEIEELARWTSATSGATYPSRWRVRVPAHGVELELAPWIADQELGVSFTYWEGAVDAFARDGATAGRGYVELVGYAERPSDSSSASRAAR